MMIAQDQKDDDDQQHHHDLDREGRAREKREQREIDLLRRRKGLGIHQACSFAWPHLCRAASLQ